jgi:hypothetical protein
VIVPCGVVAEAVIATAAGATKDAPAAGDVNETTGADGAVTVILTGAEVVEVPLLPVAFAVNE